MEPVWKIKIRSKDKKALIDYIFNERLDTSCGGPKKLGDGTYEIEAYTKDKQKNAMISRKSNLLDIEIHEDLMQSAVKKQDDISKENRYSKAKSKDADPNPMVKGFGVKE
ncbi:hypothetical protein NARC_80099 [Candidatus Nitrosocosmicus arcticus]|uniref:Uncharacterized protein n=2 Tax=Candidatus Nitrosocosmicus arcticus TaxID=2035267 RepID=A0A557SUW4_9ARCH|nr:hypothetical protein NARC_80099 [Candidatus Nitrosocosmicus arcticus]